jgi:putative lipoprotein (rSAM/lipoprotein system)
VGARKRERDVAKTKTVLEQVQEILDGIDGVGRRALLVGVPAAVLATSGCVAAYGSPLIEDDEYLVDGTVVSSETGDPIEGIEIYFDNHVRPTATTDAEGRWTIDISSSSDCMSECAIAARDTDGAQNGAFQDLETTITTTQVDPGQWVAHDVELELDPE